MKVSGFSVLMVGLLLVTTLQLAGCNDKKKSVNTVNVNRIAEKILTAISKGRADEVYDTYFTPEFRQQLSRKDWKEMVEAYKFRMGDFKSLKRTQASTIIFDGDAEGTFGFSVQWAKGQGSATLTMSQREDWLLADIQIIPPPAQDNKSMVTSSKIIPPPPPTKKITPPSSLPAGMKPRPK